MKERIEKLRAFAKKSLNANDLVAEIKRDAGMRKEINSLYSILFREPLKDSGCGNCLADALILILNTSKMDSKVNTIYTLKRGIVLHDSVNLDSSKVLTYKNVTDELAEYHLRINPNAYKYFDQLPSDWQDRAVEKKEVKQKLPKKGEVPAVNSDTKIETEFGYNSTEEEIMAEKIRAASTPKK